MTKTKSIYLALLAVLLSPMAANAIPVTSSVGDYEVTLVEGLFENLPTLPTQIWWGDEVLASEFAGLVQDDLGLTLGELGPLFAYGVASNNWTNMFAWTTEGGFCSAPCTPFVGGPYQATPGVSFVFAVAVPSQSVPEPGTLALLGLGLVGMAARRRKLA